MGARFGASVNDSMAWIANQWDYLVNILSYQLEAKWILGGPAGQHRTCWNVADQKTLQYLVIDGPCQPQQFLMLPERFDREFFGQPLMYQKVHELNISVMQNLHRMVLPLSFSNSFFKSLLATDSRSFLGSIHFLPLATHSLLVLLGEKAIGFICFKINNEHVLYLQSFGFLPVYQRSGIGTLFFFK